MEDEVRMREIVQRLEETFPPVHHYWLDDPFQVLVATVLSQNTSDRNSHRAFAQLRERFNVTPQALAQLKPQDIKPAIEIAGLSDIRSRRIIKISEEVLKRFDGDLCKVFRLPLDEARGTLMEMEGVGPKTADVLLCFVGGFPVMPVDTNIFRVVNRLCFAKGRNYERTRRTLERLIPPEKLLEMHFHLLRLGREICKPRNPLCQTCPVNRLCEYGVKLIREKEENI